MAVSAVGQDIAAAISRFGLTQKQVASMLGVSDRMVRKLITGERPGTSTKGLPEAARELRARGSVSVQPTHRAQKVRVRGGGTRRKEQAAEGLQGARGGWRAQYMREGRNRAQTIVELPERGPGREAARRAILDDLRAHRGGSRGAGGWRVKAQVVSSRTGNTYTLGAKGGYDPRELAKRIELYADGDFAAWFVEELAASGVCSTPMPRSSKVVTVILTYVRDWGELR